LSVELLVKMIGDIASALRYLHHRLSLVHRVRYVAQSVSISQKHCTDFETAL